jgi:uncharacterized protein YggT (Ycf19 family)
VGVVEELVLVVFPGMCLKTLNAPGPPQIWLSSPGQIMLQLVDPKVAPLERTLPQ